MVNIFNMSICSMVNIFNWKTWKTKKKQKNTECAGMNVMRLHACIESE